MDVAEVVLVVSRQAGSGPNRYWSETVILDSYNCEHVPGVGLGPSAQGQVGARLGEGPGGVRPLPGELSSPRQLFVLGVHHRGHAQEQRPEAWPEDGDRRVVCPDQPEQGSFRFADGES